MMLDYDALTTLTALIQNSSFEQASRRLHVTPSAVSQRIPQLEVRDALDSGQLVELIPDSPLDIPLYWQSPSLMREALSELTAAVQNAAKTMLIQTDNDL